MSSTYNEKLTAFIKAGIDDKPVTPKYDPFWQSLRSTGTELWLDTGDMDEAEANWTAEMTALTTNNTLLNNEIQKGIYDSFVPRALELVSHLSVSEQVKEIAFIVNARHGLRLAKKFGGMVSVELHTDTAYDINAIVSYGLRYRDLCPGRFIVKVPYTPEGLIGARLLHEKGVRINFTLEFSARQNALVTLVARPDYLNVFLGRIGALVADNKLGDGSGAGENAVLSSQSWVTRLSEETGSKTRQIAASLRNFNQLDLLAGTDVYTIPPKVAAAGRKSLPGMFESKLNNRYDVPLSDEAAGLGIEKFWEVSKNVVELGRLLGNELPTSGEELVRKAHDAGLGDMFPVMSREDNERLAAEGKIPVLASWKERVLAGELALDTLLTLAGIASFTADQKQLDDRVRGIIG
jgi:transaldolase